MAAPDNPHRRRRRFLQGAGALMAQATLGATAFDALAATPGKVTMPFANGERELVAFPQKRPLILLTNRPPQLETPFSVFNEGVITPNDAFFVRYHLADIPLEIDPDKFRLEVKGKVAKPLSLSLRELKSMPAVEIVAVNQCSGNSRGFVEPRVAGGQLGNGAMGNARWRGVSLKTVLEKAGVQAGAVQVAFAGLDGPAAPDTPDFTKALALDHARDGEVMLAYAMNGTDLPWLNGYPLRLIVPWKYGFKGAKSIIRISFVAEQPKTTWESLAPDEYGFYANVNPTVDHPRWSQARERRLPSGLFSPNVRPTLMFNGYADEVASLYAGMDLRKNY